jgi:hypothetical protein
MPATFIAGIIRTILGSARLYITPVIPSRGRLRRGVYFLVGAAGGGVGDGAGFGLPPSGFGK